MYKGSTILCEVYLCVSFEDWCELFFSSTTELDPTSSIYYSNRAMVLICLEDYPAALEDALKAIRLNERFVKVCMCE